MCLRSCRVKRIRRNDATAWTSAGCSVYTHGKHVLGRYCTPFPSRSYMSGGRSVSVIPLPTRERATPAEAVPCQKYDNCADQSDAANVSTDRLWRKIEFEYRGAHIVSSCWNQGGCSAERFSTTHFLKGKMCCDCPWPCIRLLCFVLATQESVQRSALRCPVCKNRVSVFFWEVPSASPSLIQRFSARVTRTCTRNVSLRQQSADIAPWL